MTYQGAEKRRRDTSAGDLFISIMWLSIEVIAQFSFIPAAPFLSTLTNE